MAEQRRWEKTPFWNLVERMRGEQYLKNAAGMGGFYSIDVFGILEAEETAIAPKELTKANQEARIKILVAVLAMTANVDHQPQPSGPELYGVQVYVAAVCGL